MKIYKNKFNTLPMQVEENMKNIELLASIIKESYRSTTDLGDTATIIAIADTNANADTIDGWLISQDGYLYKITGGDGTNLLLEYYTRLKGKNGSEDIDDNTTSLTKLWSSEKTANEILGLIDDGNTLNNKTWSSDKIAQVISYVKDKGIYVTDTQPSIDGGGSYYADEDILNPSAPNPPRYSDLIIYIDGDGKTKYLYQVTGVSGDGTKYYVTQIAEFGGGTQLYQHNILIESANLTFWITIINNNPNTMNASDIYNYLSDNSLTGATNCLKADGKVQISNVECVVCGLVKNVNQDTFQIVYYPNGSYTPTVNSGVFSSPLIYDNKSTL